MGSDGALVHLKLVNEQLKHEREILRRQIEDQQTVINQKTIEVTELLRNGSGGNPSEAYAGVLSANERLMQQLTIMEEKMRKMESFNQSYVSQVDLKSDRFGL